MTGRKVIAEYLPDLPLQLANQRGEATVGLRNLVREAGSDL